MKFIFLLVLAIFASLPGFLIHVITVEWLPSWIGSQMQGVEIKPSWAVRYAAAITSIEYGFAMIGLYYLSRDKLVVFGMLKSSLLLSIILLGLNSLFLRQPLMDFLIGNPIHVVVVQNLFKWLPFVLMSFVTVYGYEFLNRRFFK